MATRCLETTDYNLLEELVSECVLFPIPNPEAVLSEWIEMRDLVHYPFFSHVSEIVLSDDGTLFVPNGTYITLEDGRVYKVQGGLTVPDCDVTQVDKFCYFTLGSISVCTEGKLVTAAERDQKESSLHPYVQGLIQYLRSKHIEVVCIEPDDPRPLLPNFAGNDIRYAYVVETEYDAGTFVVDVERLVVGETVFEVYASGRMISYEYSYIFEYADWNGPMRPEIQVIHDPTDGPLLEGEDVQLMERELIDAELTSGTRVYHEAYRCMSIETIDQGFDALEGLAEEEIDHGFLAPET